MSTHTSMAGSYRSSILFPAEIRYRSDIWFKDPFSLIKDSAFSNSCRLVNYLDNSNIEL